MKKLSLAQVKTNHKVKVIEILGGHNLQRRLMSMGLYKGKELVKLSHIGMRGPAVIRIGRSILALGHGVAMKVIVEVE